MRASGQDCRTCFRSFPTRSAGEEIEQQYDEMVKYAAAMQTRTADPEAVLRRLSRAKVMHPT
jgi:TnpA family transposase